MESNKINRPGSGAGIPRQPSKVLPRSSFFLLACSCLLIALAGCPYTSPAKPKSSESTKVGRGDLPPLKIGIVDCDELSETIQSRWQEFSEQPIELIPIPRDGSLTKEVPSLDVVLYPASFLGSLSENDWIAPVPATLIDRLGGGKKTSKTQQDPTDSTEQGIEGWSSRWRSVARYNGKWMALPLGAPCWVAATRGLDIEPLKQLQQAIGSNQNSPKIAADTFESFLSKAEANLADSQPARREQLAKILQDKQSINRRALVDRFLWIMSTSESRYRGLIDPYKVTARLGLPEFARSARVLQRLALLEPSTIVSSPVDAWEKVVQGQATFAIGWPRSDGFQRADLRTDLAPLQLVPILYNGGDGILVSIGRKTRQSSMATEFMNWINREDNRVALQAKSPRIEVLEIDSDVNRIREDYREYQTLQRLEAANTTLDMTPRFLNADPLIESLADALLSILEKPEAAEAILEECKTKWTMSIENTGAEFLRNSLEKATGLSN